MPEMTARLGTSALATLCLAGAGLASAWALAGEPPSLGLPIDCRVGADCFVMQYVDHDEGKGHRDFQCRHRTYDGHSGTDIALSDPTTMEKGVAVLAAAGGKVTARRDGVADMNVRDQGSEAIRHRECGNGVIIDHGDGWSTQYCHMRRGTVLPRVGQNVKAGERIGEIGLSGDTEFPHVHLTVRHGNRVIDPFVGAVEDIHTSCGVGERPLWNRSALAALEYRPVTVYRSGFVGTKPAPEDVRRFRVLPEATIDAGSPSLTLFFVIIGLARHDKVLVRIVGPDGGTVREFRHTADADRIIQAGFSNAGRPGPRWKPGRYTGLIEIELGPASGTGTVRQEVSTELR